MIKSIHKRILELAWFKDDDKSHIFDVLDALVQKKKLNVFCNGLSKLSVYQQAER
jgi:hypothetical protein